MHGRSVHDSHLFSGPLRLWWGKAGEGPNRPRNLFGSFEQRPQMFRAGGCISHEGVVDRNELHRLMGKLEGRIRAEDPDGRPDNDRIPSGYTYLLQFIAHDMVDSVVSFSIDRGALYPGSRNARSAPLMLDTLYGSGPDEYPQAYEFRSENIGGTIPRRYLRVGPPPSLPRPAGICPFRDIARSAPNSMDEGQPTPTTDDPYTPVQAYLTEVMIADPRNDAHALISQLTVLLHLLHNHILRETKEVTHQIPTLDALERRDLAYRQFAYARLIVTLIYRNIIEKDVLDKILDCRIYKEYVTNGRILCDSAEGIPLEFTFGAFRFGHSMVRDSYATNSPNEKPTDEALILSSQWPSSRPVTVDWFLDWARFFCTKPSRPGESIIRPNLSKAIGPYYPGFLERSKNFPPVGLPLRDLLSASYAGMLSVPALCQLMQDKGFPMVDDFDFAKWRRELETWLIDADHSGFRPGDPDTQAIADDPPLPFFVLFEAAKTNRGERLGPIGSIIVAEAILGAIRRYGLGVEEPGLTQKARVDNCGRLLFGTIGDAVSLRLLDVADIATMSDLLDYMRRKQAYE